MPELRRDPIGGFWTIISTERGWRPQEYQPKLLADERLCPFCEHRESETPPEVYAIRHAHTQPNGPGWEVRAILSKSPLLSYEDDVGENGSCGQGIYDWRYGIGRHEIIIETPHHRQDLEELSEQSVQKVLHVYGQRLQEMEKDPRFSYCLLFKNHGLVSGSAKDVIRHARSQIIGMPILPKRAKEELAATKNYFERRDRCVFCDLLRQEKAEGQRIVFQNEHFIVLCPYASRSPFEMWLLPIQHSADFGKLPGEWLPFLAQAYKTCLLKLRCLMEDPPYNMVLHTAPYRHRKKGEYWKTIEEDYHWYLQIMPRLTHNAGFEWGTGIYINPTPPEEAAMLLREQDISK